MILSTPGTSSAEHTPNPIMEPGNMHGLTTALMLILLRSVKWFNMNKLY